jgi:predicted RNase H-like HicB family nuclease
VYKVWYWAFIDQNHDKTFVAHLADLPDVAATGVTDKDALASLSELAVSHIQQLVDQGQPPPRPSNASEIVSTIRSKAHSRALVAVEMPRALARSSTRAVERARLMRRRFPASSLARCHSACLSCRLVLPPEAASDRAASLA